MRNRIKHIPITSEEERLEKQLAESNLLLFQQGHEVSTSTATGTDCHGSTIEMTFLCVGPRCAMVLAWKRLS